MVEMVKIAARGVDSTQTSIPAPSLATNTITADLAASSSANSNNSSSSASQSPLLFFVALGFGVVFTNLWYALTQIALLSPHF